MAGNTSSGARTRARELLLQAVYQKQIAGHDRAELARQFKTQTAYDRVDQAYFDEALATICDQQTTLEDTITGLIDRPLANLDPVERGILLIGVYELQNRVDVPYRVVINEGVNLGKRFASIEGHKYVNACLDKAARSLRGSEVG